MSYLHSPRLVFSGDFEADVSTVNNDVRHYDVATFERRFQEPSAGNVQNGWWNPGGGSAFRFVGCRVRGAVYDDGTATADAAAEPLVGKLVAGPGDRSSGKMIDLDPQMQMTSELWGITLRIYGEQEGLVVEGDLLPPGFRDLQTRQVAAQSQNGQPLGASWTSVLSGLRWGPAAEGSRLLRELREATEDGLLAVQLTAFGYYYAHSDGRFSMGRLLGAVGPYRRGEPKLFAAARRLVAPPSAQVFSYGNFLFDEERGRLTVDFGGSFPIVDPQGTVADAGTLRLAVARIGDVPLTPPNAPAIAAGDRAVIGEVDYRTPGDWLAATAGLVDYEVGGEAATLLHDHQLLLLGPASNSGDRLLATETAGGLAVRADQNVQRLDPGETARVEFYARQWGRPLAGAEIRLGLSRPSRSGGGPSSDPDPPTAPIPFTNLPADALTFPASLTTGADGRAELEIEGGDPRNPRGYIDGQIYQILYGMDGLPRSQQYFLDQVIVHLRDAWVAPERPTWEDVRPILTQFGNLYPLMSRHIVDLSDREAVLRHRDILLFSFTRELADPVYMPATRDLSKAKLETVVRWLRQASAEEEEPVAAAAAAAGAARQLAEPTDEDLARPAAVQMSRARFAEMTRGQGGKIDALEYARESVELVDEP